MPFLFSLGQHPALIVAQARLEVSEKMFAYLDDIYLVCRPNRVAQVYALLQEELWRHSRIRIHGGKTQVWNMSGTRPAGCDLLERIAQQSDPEARVWRGSELPLDQQGVTILGTPLIHPDFVSAQLQQKIQDHRILLERIPAVTDVQSAWSLLLHCASARANYIVWCGLISSEHLQLSMTKASGSVVARFWVFLPLKSVPSHEILPHCRLHLVGWDSEARHEPVSPRFGPVGLIA